MERWSKEFEFKTNTMMVFLSMCYSLSVNMPRTHTRVIGGGGAGGASILEVFRVLAQTRSLNNRVVESQRNGGRVLEWVLFIRVV